MESLDKFLANTPSKWHSRKVSKEHQLFLTEKYPSYGLKDQIWFYLTGQQTEPKCSVCNGVLKKRDATTCSTKCRGAHGKTTGVYKAGKEKAAITCQTRYGVTNPAQIPATQEKRIKTCITKYGSKVSDRTRIAAAERASNLNTLGRSTLLERYGVTNPGQLPLHNTRCKETLLSHYGVDHYFKSAEFKERSLAQRKLKWTEEHITVTDVVAPEDNGQANHRIHFRCNVCSNSEILPTETFKWRINKTGTPCTTCSGVNKGSVLETEVADFLAQHCKIERNNRKIIAPYELDIIVPEKNLAIEFNGLFWHNSLRIDNNYHLNKLNMCTDAGYRLIHIFEDEWVHSPDIVKSRLLAAIGVFQKRLYARHCTVKELSPNEANTFLNDNHIQHSGRATVHLGLVQGDKLLAVMTFLNGDITKSLTGWELNRFCTLKNTNIIGSAGKLFKYFLRRENPDIVTSYADRRWSRPNAFYPELGFKLTSNTRANYWYVKPNETKRIHRFALRKPANCPVTEQELRASEGYLRIYDCGHAKYVWQK